MSLDLSWVPPPQVLEQLDHILHGFQVQSTIHILKLVHIGDWLWFMHATNQFKVLITKTITTWLQRIINVYGPCTLGGWWGANQTNAVWLMAFWWLIIVCHTVYIGRANGCTLESCRAAKTAASLKRESGEKVIFYPVKVWALISLQELSLIEMRL